MAFLSEGFLFHCYIGGSKEAEVDFKQVSWFLVRSVVCCGKMAPVVYANRREQMTTDLLYVWLPTPRGKLDSRYLF